LTDHLILLILSNKFSNEFLYKPTIMISTERPTELDHLKVVTPENRSIKDFIDL